MTEFLFKTNGSTTGKKPRVYFTCHPEDFEKYFEKICEDILRIHDCVIYYTSDMTAEIEAENKDADLGQMNLFVIPVTFRLLTQPNRAMDSDFQYAMEKKINVLPMMMESGIDLIYSRPDKFGELQYLNPYSQDATEISYEEKLKKYLDSVLISDEMAKRVRAAFDAYIFLSYRKKDRRYANELMRLIHAKPECRDIAIWYDEFLTPGESFQENIQKTLRDSKLFALLVTPNLLEEPNFVMNNEYPAAKESGMGILPAEMEKTDQAELHRKYTGIPECVDPRNDEAFYTRLLKSLVGIAVSTNDNDPGHNYLIGLAYLDGIDVEIDKERGLALITQAAEAGLREAVKKLYDIYNSPAFLDYRKAVIWAEKLAEYDKRTLGERHPNTLVSLNNLALTYSDLGEYKRALELKEKVCDARCSNLGEDHPDTLGALSNLAFAYGKLGEYQKEAELEEKVCASLCRVLGEEHSDTLTSLNNLAVTYGNLGEYTRALDLHKKVYAARCRVLGEEHSDTLTSLNNLAVSYGDLGDYRKEAELEEKVYASLCIVLGEEHPYTLRALSNLAFTYGKLGEHQKEAELDEKVYAARCRVLGEEHPDTLGSLNNLAVTYSDLGEYKRALELHESVCASMCRVLGEDHPATLTSLSNLALAYSDVGEDKRALELHENVCASLCRVLGEERPSTLISLNNLAAAYDKLGEHKRALELHKKVYAIRCRVLGKDHPDTIVSLNNIQNIINRFC